MYSAMKKNLLLVWLIFTVKCSGEWEADKYSLIPNFSHATSSGGGYLFYYGIFPDPVQDLIYYMGRIGNICIVTKTDLNLNVKESYEYSILPNVFGFTASDDVSSLYFMANNSAIIYEVTTSDFEIPYQYQL